MKVHIQYLSTIRWCGEKKYLQITLPVFASNIIIGDMKIFEIGLP